MSRRNFQPMGLAAALLSNALVLAVAVWAFWLHGHDSGLFRTAVREDESVEWSTFWAFLLAAAIFAAAAWRQRRSGVRIPWFMAGLACFCWLFAMEEISWAQRLFAYRPPVYFLENNFQQEPNFHNVLGTDLRKAILKTIIGGYGVLFPLLALIPVVGRRLRRLGLGAPPVELVPAFAATLYLYVDYPWSYAGEVVELMLGLAFLGAALAAFARASDRPEQQVTTPTRIASIAGAGLVVAALGLATAAAVRNQQAQWPENISLATTEIEALKADLLAMSDLESESFPTRCGLHKRFHGWVEKYGKEELYAGRFAALRERGLPAERADYFLDPWNAPYWIRDRCDSDDDRRSIFVYSFGPNRQRDSSRWQVLDDDVGVSVFAASSND